MPVGSWVAKKLDIKDAEIKQLKAHVATLQELRELDRVLIAKLRAEIELVSK